MNRNFILLISLLGCIYGCNGGAAKQPVLKNSDTLIPSKAFVSDYKGATSFCDTQIAVRKKLTPEKMETNPRFFSYDFIYNKGLIFATDHLSNVTKITVYDTSGVFKGGFLNVGRGPNEVLKGRNLAYRDGEYSFLDTEQGKLVVFKEKTINDFLKNYSVLSENRVVPDRVIKLSGSLGITSNAIPFDDKIAALPQGLETGNAVTIMDTTGQPIRSFGEYVTTIDQKIIQPAETNQCKIVLNKELNRLAICYINTDLVEFYDIDKGILLKRVHGPHGFYIDYTDHRETSGSQTIQAAQPGRGSRTAHTKAVGRAGKIWTLYSGGARGDDNYPTSLIYVFDWEGTPTACYELEGRNVCFDVDTENNAIIALQWEIESGELRFRRYKIEE